MSGLEFLASVVDSLAWPVAIVILAFKFGKFLPRGFGRWLGRIEQSWLSKGDAEAGITLAMARSAETLDRSSGAIKHLKDRPEVGPEVKKVAEEFLSATQSATRAASKIMKGGASG